MSRIYFHTQHGKDVEVYGTERAYMGVLCRSVAAGVFSMLRWEDQLALLPANHYVRQSEAVRTGLGIAIEVERAFSQMLGGFIDDKFADGTEIFGTVLNTCLAIGNDPLRLAAKLHGQCEIHAYVEPQDAAWVADIIERGLGAGVFREGSAEFPSGWRAVIDLLRSTTEPVVTSYSVCESFPNAWVADWEAPVCDACDGDGKPNERMKFTDVDYDYCTTCGGQGCLHDAWYDLPDDERWELGLRGLRSQVVPPRLAPDGWPGHFGDGKTAFTILGAGS